MADAPSAARQTALATATLNKYLTKPPEDSVSYKKVLLDRMLSKQRSFDGGRQVTVSAHKKNNQAGITRTTYANSISFATVDTTALMNFQWRTLINGTVLDQRTVLEQHMSPDVRRGQIRNSDDMKQIFNVWEEDLLAMREGFFEVLSSDLYDDGAQSTQAPVGLSAMISKTPSTGSLGGIDRSASGNAWFRNLAADDVAQNQLISTIENLHRRAMTFGGGPTFYICGGKMFDALRSATKSDNGVRRYQQLVEASKGKMDATIEGVYACNKMVHWDPALDVMDDADSGNDWGKRLYAIDERVIKMRIHSKDRIRAMMRIPSPDEIAYRSQIQCSWVLTAKKLNSSFVMELA